MKLRGFFCIVFIVLLMPVMVERASARLKLLDSLLSVYPTLTDDSARVRFLVNIAYQYQFSQPDSGIYYGMKSTEVSTRIKWMKGIAMGEREIGENYKSKGMYAEAADHFFASLRAYEQARDSNGIANIYHNISVVYQYENQYRKCIDYAQRALQLSWEIHNDFMSGICYSELGIAYEAMHIHDSALVFHLKSLDICNKLNAFEGIAKAYGNIGLIYNAKRDYPKALEYYMTELNMIRNAGLTRWLGVLYANIGELYLNMVRKKHPAALDRVTTVEDKVMLQKAMAYLDSAAQLNKEVSDRASLQFSYENMAEAAHRLGNYDLAYDDLEKSVALKDSLYSTESKIKISNIEAKHELEIREKQIELDKLTLAKQKNERWLFMSIIVLMTISGILYINSQRLKKRKLEAEKLNAEMELTASQQMLESFKQNMQDKNRIIEHFSGELERYKTIESNELHNETLIQLQQSTILTDEQWENFRILFEKVHKGFFNRIREKMPDLTPGEIRFLALSKLKLSAKEMTNILGISLSTIRNYRLRLRRKLELDEDASLEEIADAV